jgi:hypothetical protein
MLIAMIAGAVVSAASVMGCPPETAPSEGERLIVPQMGHVVQVKLDDPAPGKVDCMGTPAVAAGKVSMSEAPYGEQFTDASLGKVWVSAKETATLKEFAAAIGQGAEREVFVDWDRLKKAGLNEEMKIATPLKHVGLEQAMRIVNERMGAGGKLAVRRTGDLIEVSTQETFDRREKYAVAFDVRPLLKGDDEAQKQKLHEIVEAMTTTVDAEGWAENGGDTSRQSFSEGKLFVVAPPRVQKAVAWFFGQVSEKTMAGAEGSQKGDQAIRVELAKLEEMSKQQLEARISVLEQSLRILQAEYSAAHPSWREATQGHGDYASFK